MAETKTQKTVTVIGAVILGVLVVGIVMYAWLDGANGDAVKQARRDYVRGLEDRLVDAKMEIDAVLDPDDDRAILFHGACSQPVLDALLQRLGDEMRAAGFRRLRCANDRGAASL